MATRKLKDALVVITGATSGIGRATALAFASQGSHVVLAARDPEGLNQTAIACRERGALAHTNVTDVTNSAAVTFLAEYAAELGDGRIDVWINNAGVGAVGDFLETPLEAHEQVIRTNLLGYLYGAYAALPYFVLHQKGVLINNISFGAWFPAPYAAAYSASKFGVEGFSDALRGELSRWRQIRICDVYPAFVNTPGIAEHAATYADRNLGSPGLAVEPEKVAEVMVDLARRPRDKVTIGALARATRAARTLSPGIARTLTSRLAERVFASGAPRSSTSGALFEPQPGNRELGTSPQPRHRLRTAVTALSVGSSAVLLGRWLSSDQGKRTLEQTRSWLAPKLKLLKP